MTPQAPDTFDDGEPVTATATDSAGNVSDPANDEIDDPAPAAPPPDTTPPIVPTVTASSGADDTPVISGTATIGAGETLTVTINDVTYTAGDGNLVDNNDGTWDLQIPVGDALPDGTYEVTATVTDAAGNSSTDTSMNEIVVSSAPPPSTIAGLAITSTPANAAGYEAGETVQVTVTFNENVTATGLPFIELDIGGKIVAASFVSGSGTTDLVFEYAIESGEEDINGISIASDAVILNGGTIGGPGGSDLTHSALADDPAQLVASPSILNFTLTGGGDPAFNGLATGSEVGSAGDVNGDGFDDFIIGAPEQDNFAVFGNSGRAFVVFGGGDGSPIDLNNLAPEQGFAINGASRTVGERVAAVGDVDGDGLDDFIVSAKGESAAYLIFGQETGMTVDLSAIAGGSGQGVRLTSTIHNGLNSGSLGRDVAGLGDVNGDGLADFAVSTRGTALIAVTTRTFVVFGSNSFGPTFDVDAVIPGNSDGFVLNGQFFRINGSTNDGSGARIESAGDINGDGFNDLAVFAEFSIDQPSGSTVAPSDRFSTINIIFGGANVPSVNALDLITNSNPSPNPNGFTITGAGAAFASVGDVNGDGLDDLLTGNTVVFGRTDIDNFALSDVGVNPALPGFRILNSPGGISSVASAGDFNGDGVQDFVVGSTNAERAFVLFGQAGVQADIDIANIETGGANGFAILDGSNTGRDFNLGTSVSSAGDINGDGFDDILVSAPYEYTYDYDDEGSSVGGGSFVIFGNDSGDTDPVDVSVLNSGGTVIAPDAVGTAGDDVINGTTNSEILFGGRGNDTISGNAGADVINGGSGDDTIILDANGNVGSFVDNLTAIQSGPLDGVVGSVDGGNGEDTLVIDGAGVTLDFTNLGDGRIDSIEAIDITGDGDNTLTIGLNDVFDLSESSNQLIISGDTGDTVNLSGGFIDTGNNPVIGGQVFDEFMAGNAIVLIDQDVTQNVI